MEVHRLGLKVTVQLHMTFTKLIPASSLKTREGRIEASFSHVQHQVARGGTLDTAATDATAAEFSSVKQRHNIGAISGLTGRVCTACRL